jgi:hypothetical protein
LLELNTFDRKIIFFVENNTLFWQHCKVVEKSHVYTNKVICWLVALVNMVWSLEIDLIWTLLILKCIMSKKKEEAQCQEATN